MAMRPVDASTAVVPLMERRPCHRNARTIVSACSLTANVRSEIAARGVDAMRLMHSFYRHDAYGHYNARTDSARDCTL